MHDSEAHSLTLEPFADASLLQGSSNSIHSMVCGIPSTGWELRRHESYGRGLLLRDPCKQGLDSTTLVTIVCKETCFQGPLAAVNSGTKVLPNFRTERTSPSKKSLALRRPFAPWEL